MARAYLQHEVDTDLFKFTKHHNFEIVLADSNILTRLRNLLGNSHLERDI